MIDFVIKNRATLCGESISPVHQHIQSYRNTQGEIQVHENVEHHTLSSFKALKIPLKCCKTRQNDSI